MHTPARAGAGSVANAAHKRDIGVQPADITFVVLTKNEASNITQCLQSLPKGSASLVYDAQSSDETSNLAVSLGAAVVQAPWEGYVRARAAAVKLVSTPWTFMLDADERLSIALCRELAQIEPALDVSALSVPRRNWFCGRWLRSAGWWPDRLVRLFRTGTAEVVPRSANAGATLHETWLPSGRCDELSQPIEHYSYRSTHDYRKKFVQYTDIEARTARASTVDAIAAWFLMPMRLGWLLVGRRGILEGWRGIYVCAGSALYPAVVATKARFGRRRFDNRMN
jgi:glycosyltransferase involved in cell wall biosynthesis